MYHTPSRCADFDATGRSVAKCREMLDLHLKPRNHFVELGILTLQLLRLLLSGCLFFWRGGGAPSPRGEEVSACCGQPHGREGWRMWCPAPWEGRLALPSPMGGEVGRFGAQPYQSGGQCASVSKCRAQFHGRTC